MANKVIDPAPIIKKLADRCLVAKGLECSILGELIDALRAAPAVDAVEVVRCKDCRYLYDEPDAYCCANHKGMVKITADSFCCHGERKDNERKAD